MKPRRRMHRQGWLRFDRPGGPGESEWLIYQSRRDGTLNAYYDGGRAEIGEDVQSRIATVLRNHQLPDKVEVRTGLDSNQQCFVGVEIPGFVFDDDSNWDELRSILRCIMEPFLRAVDSALGVDELDR